MAKCFYLGNELMAYAAKIMGVSSFYAYPGTPSSEILSSFQKYSEESYCQWSINEKVAFELAAAAAISGNISACAMKQVGLNVASDALFSVAYTGITGSFVIFACDDSGPFSSQTEQDSRLYAYSAKIPVLDPASPIDAYNLTKKAFEISNKYKVPVIVRSGMRVCHSRQSFQVEDVTSKKIQRKFVKDVNRWAATPKYRSILHKNLLLKIENIADDFYENFKIDKKNNIAIVASGYPYSIFLDIQDEYKNIDLIKIDMPYPIPDKIIKNIENSYNKILVLEETMPLLENAFKNRQKVYGKNTGNVILSGEFTVDICKNIVDNFLNDEKLVINNNDDNSNSSKPYLCVGCGHRSSFFAIKRAAPTGIFPSDIGCYTLGINLKTVDTCICMGASISFAESLKRENPNKDIVCTIGDSTFFHSGIPALLNAKINNSPIVVAILNNDTTAMTGFQPVAHNHKNIKIENVVKGLGIEFVKTTDAYDMNTSTEIVKNALKFAESNSCPAVVIFEKECVTKTKLNLGEIPFVDKGCTNCGMCYEVFQCPAISYNGHTIVIDDKICNGCMCCTYVCPTNIIKRSK